MTLLARIEHAGRPRVGILEGEGIRLHEGTIFDPGPATGEIVAAADARWLTPTEWAALPLTPGLAPVLDKAWRMAHTPDIWET